MPAASAAGIGHVSVVPETVHPGGIPPETWVGGRWNATVPSFMRKSLIPGMNEGPMFHAVPLIDPRRGPNLLVLLKP